MTGRLPPQPGEIIDRDTSLRFRWNGRRLNGLAGDTIASALLANDVRIVSRSMKYHRPRGWLTADHWDPNGFVQVGDDPNVRSGHRRLAEGMEVEAQNVWPSLGFDVKAANVLVVKGREPAVKIIDFGLAGLDPKGRLIGTPSYMSPEIVAREQADGRADLYSLGVLWYSCVTHKNPFRASNAKKLGVTSRAFTRVAVPPPPRIGVCS